MIQNAQTEEIKFQPITTQRWLGTPFDGLLWNLLHFIITQMH